MAAAANLSSPLLASAKRKSGEAPMSSGSKRRLLSWAAAIIASIAALQIAPPARAQNPDDIAAGFRLFRQKGNCQACHGWAGDGRKMDSQMPDGANLRQSALDRQNLIMTIKCGRPGTGMPAFDKFAYSDGRCYGLKQADLKARGLQVADPSSPLISREVENIVDFLYAKVIGKGPINHAGCIEYWGSDIDLCKDLPN